MLVSLLLVAGCDEDETGTLYGVTSGHDQRDVSAVGELGAGEARVAVPIGTPSAEMREVVAAHADRGVRLLLVAEFPEGRLPTAAEARGLAGWAREFGPGGSFWEGRDGDDLAVRAIEFGNETSYPQSGVAERGGEYAERARDAVRALERAGTSPAVGLLVQADDAEEGSDWVDSMFTAVPRLGRLAAGWTVHPYGPGYRNRVKRLVAQTERAGAPSTVPVFVTEWGVASAGGRCLEPDNYGWDPCMDYGEAAVALQSVAGTLEKDLGARLGGFYVYNARDLARPSGTSFREHYFGALAFGNRPKGEYTDEVMRVLGRSGGGG